MSDLDSLLSCEGVHAVLVGATRETLHTSCRSVGDSRTVAIVSPFDWPPCLPSLPKNDVISPRHAILLALIEGDSECERSRWR